MFSRDQEYLEIPEDRTRRLVWCNEREDRKIPPRMFENSERRVVMSNVAVTLEIPSL